MNTRSLLCPIMISVVTLMLACAPTMVQMPVQKPAEIDVKGIKNIAIVDFQGVNNSGDLAASLLTTELMSSNFFQIFERSKIDLVLEEHALAQSGVVDENTAREIGQMLGVDGLIFGEVVSYSVDPDEKGVQKVEKKVGTGQYRTVTKNKKKVREEIMKTTYIDQQYMIRRGTVAVTFRVVNIETGQLLASKAKSKSYDSGKVVEGKGTLKSRDAILNDLMADIVKEFARQIAPYVVTEKHPLESGSGSTKVGVQYAKNGLWDEAISAFQRAVSEQPKNSSTWYNLGIACMVTGDYDAAEENFNKAIALKNKNLYFQSLAHIRELRLQREKLRQQVGN
ncbi:MAG TPA: CsgG/HfaB family protein [bacterium]|nr:CsgG/HfaB family protein [bacterium]HPN42208.1 CsgG/HfaB family protein [bacterium]